MYLRIKISTTDELPTHRLRKIFQGPTLQSSNEVTPDQPVISVKNNREVHVILQQVDRRMLRRIVTSHHVLNTDLPWLLVEMVVSMSQYVIEGVIEHLRDFLDDVTIPIF